MRVIRPNTVLYAVAAVAGAAALGAVILAAEAHGKRRQMRRAWLRGPKDGSEGDET